MKTTPHEVLGVQKDADKAQIKTRYCGRIGEVVEYGFYWSHR